MFKNIIIKNFRGITELAVGDFRRVNLLVGKNNCGKTSVLEALFLASAPTNPELPLRINLFRRFGPVEEILPWRLFFNKLATNSTITIDAELQKPLEKRSLAILPLTTPVMTSAATHQDQDLVGPSTVISGIRLEAIFLQKERKSSKLKITSAAFSEANGRVGYKYAENLHLENTCLEATFLLDSMRDATGMTSRFNNVLMRKETDRIIKLLQQIDPSLSSLSLNNQGIIYCDIGLSRLVPIKCLGAGMAKFLEILLAVWDTQGGIVLIDEIENGLYHSSQKVLWNAVSKAAQEFDVQIFATTHSMDCVKAFALSYPEVFKETEDAIRVYRIERDGEQFKAVDYDYPTLKGSLEDGWEVR